MVLKTRNGMCIMLAGAQYYLQFFKNLHQGPHIAIHRVNSVASKHFILLM